MAEVETDSELPKDGPPGTCKGLHLFLYVFHFILHFVGFFQLKDPYGLLNRQMAYNVGEETQMSPRLGTTKLRFFMCGNLILVYIKPTSYRATDDSTDERASDGEEGKDSVRSDSPLTCSGAEARSQRADSEATDDDSEEVLDTREKYLIFTMGSRTYTPHQIGLD